MIQDGNWFSFGWKGRADNLEACSSKVFDLLEKIKKIHPILDHFEISNECALGLPKLLTKSTIYKVLKYEQSQNENTNQAKEESGSQIRFVSRHQKKWIDLTIVCGESLPYMNNVVSISLPKTKKIDKEFTADIYLKIFDTVIDIWNPAHGILTNSNLSDKLSTDSLYHEVGWITFLNDFQEIPVSVPSSFITIKKGNGIIILLIEGFNDLTNSQAIQSLKKMQRMLFHKKTPPNKRTK